MVYRRRYKQYKEYHSDYRLNKYFGTIVADIQDFFFSLPSHSLQSMLMNYKSSYGEGAYSYAIATYPYWKSGSRSMSDQTLLRLVETLPRFLTEQQRLHLLEKLFIDYQKRNHANPKCISITTDWNEYNIKLSNLSNDINTIYSVFAPTDFEQDIIELASWLTNDDMKVAKNILATIAIKNYNLLIRSANDDIRRFRTHCEEKQRKKLTGDYERLEIKLPTVSITFTVKKKSFFERFFG